MEEKKKKKREKNNIKRARGWLPPLTVGARRNRSRGGGGGGGSTGIRSVGRSPQSFTIRPAVWYLVGRLFVRMAVRSLAAVGRYT